MYVRAGRPAFDWPYSGVHRSTSLTISSLLLQQCPACLVRLAFIVFVKGGRWPYSWRLVGCCCQYLFNMWFNYMSLLYHEHFTYFPKEKNSCIDLILVIITFTWLMLFFNPTFTRQYFSPLFFATVPGWLRHQFRLTRLLGSAWTFFFSNFVRMPVWHSLFQVLWPISLFLAAIIIFQRCTLGNMLVLLLLR